MSHAKIILCFTLSSNFLVLSFEPILWQFIFKRRVSNIYGSIGSVCARTSERSWMWKRTKRRTLLAANILQWITQIFNDNWKTKTTTTTTPVHPHQTKGKPISISRLHLAFDRKSVCKICVCVIFVNVWYVSAVLILLYYRAIGSGAASIILEPIGWCISLVCSHFIEI